MTKSNKRQTLRGLNLGGWLVIEDWVTPSLFRGTDAKNEFQLAQTKEGRRRIKVHHDSFIQREDLVWMKRQGIDIVRVPVGYWIFGDDTRYVGAIERLDWLMDTSLSLGLQVLLDLHAAPGAQNRAAHSGSGNTVSDKHSTNWLNNTKAQDETIEIVVRLASKYAHYTHLWGIEMLNEPSVDLTGIKLARFYRRAYRALTAAARPGTHIVFSDGYAPLRLMNCLGVMSTPSFPAVLDTHVYQVFGLADKRRTYEKHLKRLSRINLFLRLLRITQPVIVGEWSAMLPIKTSDTQTSDYVKAQQNAFGVADAHFYWTYKTESDGRWNYHDMAAKQLIQ